MANPIATRDQIPPATMTRVEVDGVPVLLCNCEGTIYAIEDVCTHDGGSLDEGQLFDCKVMCPRHGALFDVKTGAALTLPAVIPVPTYAVRIEGEDIYVDLNA